MKNLSQLFYVNVKTFILLVTLSSFFMVQSCKSDDDNTPTLPEINEQESITSIHLSITQGGVSKTYIWEIGKTTPTIKLNKTVPAEVSILFYNGTTDVTGEIIAEKEDHFITYKFLTSGIDISRTDPPALARTGGVKVGFFTQWNFLPTPAPANQVNIKLHHLATVVNATGGGVTEGGSVDVDVTFPITIE